LRKSGDVASAKKGRPKKQDEAEDASLKRELQRVKEENEILKKPPYSLPRNWVEIRVYSHPMQRI
jgi:hypothetical protein